MSIARGAVTAGEPARSAARRACIDAAVSLPAEVQKLLSASVFFEDTELGGLQTAYLTRYNSELITWLQDAKQKREELQHYKYRVEKCISDLNAVASEAVVRPTASRLCPVCFDNEVDTVLVPCGHTYCSSCAGKTRAKCGICRRAVKSATELFFSC